MFWLCFLILGSMLLLLRPADVVLWWLKKKFLVKSPTETKLMEKEVAASFELFSYYPDQLLFFTIALWYVVCGCVGSVRE